MSLSNDELLSNIKRQAKRLSKNINVPLRQAQSHLAMSIYQCDSWNHLRDSLKSDALDNQLLLLAALQPNSNVFLYKLLNENLSNISSRIKESTQSDLTNNELRQIIINLFGIELADFKSKIK